MGSSLLGMDPGIVEAASADLKGQAASLTAIKSRIASLVDQAGNNWNGQDAKNFRQEWYYSYQSQVASAITLLSDMSADLTRQAHDQRVTSGGGGGGGKGLGPTPKSVAPTEPTDWVGVASDTSNLSSSAVSLTSGWLTYVRSGHLTDGTWTKVAGHWQLSKPNDGPPSTHLDKGLGIASTGLSAAGLGLGIYDTVANWGSKNTAEKVSAVAGDFSSALSTVSGVGGMLSKAGPLTKLVPGLNIAAGVTSAISDGAAAVSEWNKGNHVTAVIDGVAALGDVLSCAPPPAGLVGAGISLLAGGAKVLNNIFHLWK